MSNRYPVEPSDVSIEQLEPPTCEDCDKPATHAVMLDLRAIGTKVSIGLFCGSCAEELSKTLIDNLPEAP